MSTASDLLASGFLTLRTAHGETLGYRPASAVLASGTGEAVATESGQALLDSDEPAESITGVFDEAYILSTVEGSGYVNTAPAVTILAEDLPDVEKNALIIRNGVTYYVLEVREPDTDGAQLLILSKQIQ